MTRFKFKKLHKDAVIPTRATLGSAGMDLVAVNDVPVILAPGERKLIPSGIAASIPPGFEIQVRPRSGLALKNGVTVLNAPGTIDSDYRGEIFAMLYNASHQQFVIEKGLKMAQLVVAEYAAPIFAVVEELDDTERGAGGFGSTGMKAH
jgi:dUTP pyrophosphatase